MAVFAIENHSEDSGVFKTILIPKITESRPAPVRELVAKTRFRAESRRQTASATPDHGFVQGLGFRALDEEPLSKYCKEILFFITHVLIRVFM